MRTTDDAYPGRDASEELAAVVLRADQLGFCGWRVATALGIRASGLAAIEQHAGLTGSDCAAGARAALTPASVRSMAVNGTDEPSSRTR